MTQYEMTQKQLDKIIDAGKPVAVIMPQYSGHPARPLRNVNAVWKSLAKEMGFEYMTVRPNGKGDRFFTAAMKNEDEK